MPIGGTIPMFEDHEISWLAARLPYSEFYLTAVKYGHKPATPVFRRKCAKALDRTEAQLFGETEVKA